MESPPLHPRVLTVAKDKKGEFWTVQDAIDAVPQSNTRRTIICVSRGVYNQPIYVAKTKNFITLTGCCPETTLLTWNNTASHINHHDCLSARTSRVIGVGTFGCGSVIVEGDLTHYSSNASGELILEAYAPAPPRREPELSQLVEARSRNQIIWQRPSERFASRIVSSPSLNSRPDLSGVKAQVRKLIEDLQSDSGDMQRTLGPP